MASVTIEFPDADALRRFVVWLSNSGEQDFFQSEDLYLDEGEITDKEKINNLRYSAYTGPQVWISAEHVE